MPKTAAATILASAIAMVILTFGLSSALNIAEAEVGNGKGNGGTTPPPLPPPQPSTDASVILGVFPGNQYGNPAWDTAHRGLTQFENLIGTKAQFVLLFHRMQDTSTGSCMTTPYETKIAYVANGYTPVVTWEATNSITPDTIKSGANDACIRAEARTLKSFGPAEVYIRPFHEMNGDWMAWGIGVNGTSEQDLIDAWRHMHDVFISEEATNVKWVWSPNIRCPSYCDNHPFSSIYPGDAYVDYLALDGYNWGEAHSAPWWSFDEVYKSSYDEITALSSTKPVMIAEYASHEQAGYSKGQWITDMRNVVKTNYPRIKALLWFESNQDGALWRVDTSTGALNAYKAFTQDPYYGGTVKESGI